MDCHQLSENTSWLLTLSYERDHFQAQLGGTLGGSYRDRSDHTFLANVCLRAGLAWNKQETNRCPIIFQSFLKNQPGLCYSSDSSIGNASKHNQLDPEK